MAEFAVRPRWVDWHCHLDLFPDHQALIVECDRSATATLAITTTPIAFERNVELAAGSSHVRVALGLHPQLVSSRAKEIALFERLLSRTRFVGEVGLDASSRHYSSFHSQLAIFERVLRACDEQGGKVLSIHSVRSVSKVLANLESNLRVGGCVPVLHWFAGSRSEARRAADMGCYFSVNSEMIRSGRSLPIDRVLTETDGPFVQIDQSPSTPRDVPAVVERLSSLLNLAPNELRSQIVRNLSEAIG